MSGRETRTTRSYGYAGPGERFSMWRAGHRHQVELVTSLLEPVRLTSKLQGQAWWRCVDCGERFATWPSDELECPGPMARPR